MLISLPSSSRKLCSVSKVYEAPLRFNSRSSSVNVGLSAIASFTMAARCLADTSGCVLCGGLAEGMKRTSSKLRASASSCAMRKCP